MSPRLERMAAEMRAANVETFHRQAANREAWKRRRKGVMSIPTQPNTTTSTRPDLELLIVFINLLLKESNPNQYRLGLMKLREELSGVKES